MARSFQNNGTVEFEAMALAKAKEADDARLIERAKIVRTLNLPTDDEIIKLRLRACGLPMILFGEDPLHRRERLKEMAATMLTTDDESARRWHEIAETQKQLDESLKAAAAYGKLYYTEGGPELLATRKEIAMFSLQRAQERLENYRSFTEASHEYIARLQTLSTFYCTGSEVGDTRPLSSSSFSKEVDNDGRPKQVLISSWSGSSFVWDLQTRTLSRKLTGHRDRVSDAKFAPLSNSSSSLSIATGGVDAVVNLYSSESNTPIGTLSGHSDRIARIAFHPNRRHLVSASFDTTFRLWDLETRSCILIQDGNPRGLYGIAVHPDGSLVATGDLAGNGRIWDLRTGKTIVDLVGHIKQVLCVCVSPNGYHVATGSGDNTIRIWDLRKRSCVYTVPGHLNMVSDVKFAARDQFLLSCSYDKTLRLWSARDFSPVKTLSGHEDKLTSIDVSDDCRHLISSSFDRTWKTWTVLDDDRDRDRMIDA